MTKATIINKKNKLAKELIAQNKNIVNIFFEIATKKSTKRPLTNNEMSKLKIVFF